MLVVLLTGVGLTSRDGWKENFCIPRIRKSCASWHMSVRLMLHATNYIFIFHNPGFSLSFSRTFDCRSEGIGCVHIHSNLKELYGRFEVSGWSRTRFIHLDVCLMNYGCLVILNYDLFWVLYERREVQHCPWKGWKRPLWPIKNAKYIQLRHCHLLHCLDLESIILVSLFHLILFCDSVARWKTSI